MPIHHAFAWLVTLAVPPAVGLTLFVLMRRDCRGVLSFALALLAMALTFVFVLTLSARCVDSIGAQLTTPHRPTPFEPRDLRGADTHGPGIDLFDRDGQSECLVSNGNGDTQIGDG